MPMGVMSGSAETSDQAPPIGVSLLSSLMRSSPSGGKHAGVWVLE